MELSVWDFKILQEYIQSICGISIKEDKKYLIHQRLEPVARSFGLTSFSQFCNHLKTMDSPSLRDKVILAITTRETSFFRDSHPYEAFQHHILPKLIHKLKIRKENPFLSGIFVSPLVRIFSAGSSTGQEPYSIAILIDEYIRNNRFGPTKSEDFLIIASDISVDALDKAKRGEYSHAEVSRGVSPERLKQYFTKTGDHWQIIDTIKQMIQFRKINLTESYTIPYDIFDVIFCRNVLIYFDDPIKIKILEHFYRILSDDGFLILGAMENTYMIANQFESVRFGNAIVYTKSKRV